MSKAKKKKFNITKIASLIYSVFIIMSLLIIIGFVASKYFNIPYVGKISVYLSFLFGIPYILVKVNSKSYKRNKKL
jgi:hypothetical protein